MPRSQAQNENLLLAALAGLAGLFFWANEASPKTGRSLQAPASGGLGPKGGIIPVSGPVAPPGNATVPVPEYTTNNPGDPYALSPVPTGKSVLFDPRRLSKDAAYMYQRKGAAPSRYVLRDARPMMGHPPFWAWPASPAWLGWDYAYDDSAAGPERAA